jgi:hypothetical protein
VSSPRWVTQPAQIDWLAVRAWIGSGLADGLAEGSADNVAARLAVE